MIEIELLAKKLLNTNWKINTETYNLTLIGWIFDFNNRKKSLGRCDCKTKTIYLSEPFVSTNSENLHLWDDTIKHEIAHAIDFEIRNYTDHSENWKIIARQVGCATECENDDNLKKPISKYTLKCENCGSEASAHRTKVNKAACSSCCKTHNKGKFSSKFLLTVVKNF